MTAAPDVVEHWAVLAVIEFSSDRKRMSTVCRSPDGGDTGRALAAARAPPLAECLLLHVHHHCACSA
jgi:hypothetical protein